MRRMAWILAVCWWAGTTVAQTLVRSVLGVTIEQVEKAHRVVDADGGVLCRGSLVECERHVVALLERRHG